MHSSEMKWNKLWRACLKWPCVPHISYFHFSLLAISILFILARDPMFILDVHYYSFRYFLCIDVIVAIIIDHAFIDKASVVVVVERRRHPCCCCYCCCVPVVLLSKCFSMLLLTYITIWAERHNYFNTNFPSPCCPFHISNMKNSQRFQLKHSVG